MIRISLSEEDAMEQVMTFEEQEIMRNAYVFLKHHCNPPANSDENAVGWWTQAAQEMGAVCGAWSNHGVGQENEFDSEPGRGMCPDRVDFQLNSSPEPP